MERRNWEYRQWKKHKYEVKKKKKQNQNSDKKLKPVTIEETEMSRKYAGGQKKN